MRRLFRIFNLLIFLVVPSARTFCQEANGFRLYSRFSFYSNEQNGEMLLHIPQRFIGERLNISLKLNERILSQQIGIIGKRIIRIPLSLTGLSDSTEIVAEISESDRGTEKHTVAERLIILSHKSNEVKTDRLTGGLIVHGKPFFPFGFYCYSPVHPTLPEEEVVKGFNMISPYQKILPASLPERKAYMDRCAQLGMKVHYNLLSVSGGGGVGSKIDSLSDEQKRDLLVNEIKTFMNHPALLAWYISDEPTGHKVEPETLEEIYRTVKKIDPWHPVSIVFMAPFGSSKKFADALDIVMADPYPIPDLPPSMVGDVAGSLKKIFDGSKPVWIVPQVFGGGELWSREPSFQEVRSMTWQSIINGATGIQYFVRNGLNSFPKSTATWGECGKIALETAMLAPWILSDEETIPVYSGSKNILTASRMHNGELVIMVVNKINQPQRAEIRIERNLNGKLKVLFENRDISIYGGTFSDQIGALGSQVYKIDISKEREVIQPFTKNLILDPGFEDISSPGVPAACYARPGNDRGATYFLDPSEHVDGNYSLRLVTPAENSSVSLRFFPVTLKPGLSYMISLWAKADPEQRFIPDQEKKLVNDQTLENNAQFVEVRLGESGAARFVPGKEWKQFVTFVTIPPDTVPKKKVNLTLRMPGQGVAWFDMLQIIQDPLQR